MNNGAVQASNEREGHVEGPQEGCYVPYVAECDTGKVTSPAESQRDGTDKGEAGVAAALASCETFVGVDPYTVITVASIRLTYHLCKLGLKTNAIKINDYLAQESCNCYDIYLDSFL